MADKYIVTIGGVSTEYSDYGSAWDAWIAGDETAELQMLALDGFPPSHRDKPFCECSVCMGLEDKDKRNE